jgi:hypothetical protein
MNITTVATAEDTPPSPATGRWLITSPVEAPSSRVFRRVARLRFETGGMADRIIIDPEAATLTAVFRPYDYDALSSGEPLEATLTAFDGAVVAELDVPRQVRQVCLSSSSVLGPGYSVGFYRLDGDALADKPTVTAKLQSIKPVDESLNAGLEKAVEQPSSARVATLTANSEFTDKRFAIRLEGTDDPALGVGNLLGMKIRSYPTGPRLGLANPEDPDSAVFFWQATGEVGKAMPEEDGNVEAGKAFAKALQRHLDDFFARLTDLTDEDEDPPPIPESVEVALVMVSDAPCILDVMEFNVTYRIFLQSLFSDGGEKIEKLVLRFIGGPDTAQEVPVRLPSNATVESATLETVESFRDDRPLDSGNGDGLPDSVLAQERGVHVDAERWVVQGIVPPRAITVSGVAVALMATANNTEVYVNLQEDWHGQPSGKRLATGTLMLEEVGRRSWVTLLFPEPIILFSNLYWLLMKASGGRAVWLAEAGDIPARVLEESNNSGAWAELSVLDELQTIHRFISRSKRAQEQRSISLAIGEHTAQIVDEQDDARTYDLTSGLNDYLGGLPPDGPVATIPITFKATLPGLVTVYPLAIEYDLIG